MVAAPDALRGTGRRHRVAAIGSGVGGLTATKALRYAQVNITDALVFLARIIAQGISHVVIQTPLWLQVIPTIAGLAGTIGLLIALYLPTTLWPPAQAAERRVVFSWRRRCAGCVPSVWRSPQWHRTNSRPRRYAPRRD
jgi:hypothetical protein